jgi:hypothetical protein
MLQRSLLALVFAVGMGQPGLQALTITLLCTAFVVLHCCCQPLQDHRANSLQVALRCIALRCQCLVFHSCLLGIPPESLHLTRKFALL